MNRQKTNEVNSFTRENYNMSGYLPVPHSSAMTNYAGSTVDLLTPSTLVSLEQALCAYSTESNENMPNESYSHSAPYIPTILENLPTGPVLAIKQEYSDDDYSEDSDASSSWTSTPAKQGRVSDADSSTSSHFTSHANNANSGQKSRRSGSRRRVNDSYLTPDEYAKRQQRRERNKQAAARCRQRRVDLTNKLEAECKVLEEEKHKLEKTIEEVRLQKEQLEFLLEAHKPICGSGKLVSTSTVVLSKNSVITAAVITAAKQNPTSQNARSLLNNSSVSSNGSSSLRPNTLVLPKRPPEGLVDAGLLSTPSADFYQTMGLDIMLEGHTGLTPITANATPINAGLLSCTNQQYQRTSSSSSGESNSALMAL